MDALTPAAEFEYSPCVRELFADLAHAGTLHPVSDPGVSEGGSRAAPTQDLMVSVKAGAREQGASIRLQVRLRDTMVVAARYQAYGCPHFLAACESLARWLEGRPLQEARAWPRNMIERELAFPAHKRERLLILEDALAELISAIGRR